MTVGGNAILRARLIIVIGIVAVIAAVGWSARPHAQTQAERVDRITAELRCVVCQGLSVRDSPSESARQMRDLVTQRVAEGRTDDQIRDEFRASYGDWVVLSPPVVGWSALMWVAPLAAVLVGLGVAMRRLRAPPASLPEPPAAVVAALRERVAREERLDLPAGDAR
jgi:cytochrome c-type biogenesis protein CcmH